MSEKLSTFQIPNDGEVVKIDWDELGEYYKDEDKVSTDAELVSKKAVGKGETAKEAKEKIVAFRGARALKAVFSPENDKIAKVA